MAPDRTLIQIRERSYLDLLDLALVVVRSRPVPLGLAALAGVLPFAAINYVLMAYNDLPNAFLLGAFALEAPWATAPLTVMLGGLMFGERPSAGVVARSLARGFPAMFLYQFLLRAILIVFVVTYPLIPARYTFLDEVILLERGGLRGPLRRCATLNGLRGSEFFGFWACEVLFGGLFIGCFWLGTGGLIASFTTDELTWDAPGWGDLAGLRFQVAAWLAIAFFGVARFLNYIDQRIRLEGWEVKLRLQAVGRTIEEAARW